MLLRLPTIPLSPPSKPVNINYFFKQLRGPQPRTSHNHFLSHTHLLLMWESASWCSKHSRLAMILVLLSSPGASPPLTLCLKSSSIMELPSMSSGTCICQLTRMRTLESSISYSTPTSHSSPGPSTPESSFRKTSIRPTTSAMSIFLFLYSMPSR